MGLKDMIGQPLSYSRYRGLNDRSRYVLSDEYFCKEMNGCLICTDDEKDIGADGNICLVWEDGKVALIGSVPMLEAGAGQPRFRFGADKLTIECMVFCDNDHHHSVSEKEEISLSASRMEALRKRTEQEYAIAELFKIYEGYQGGIYRNRVGIYPYPVPDDRGNERILILIESQIRERIRGGWIKDRGECKLLYINPDTLEISRDNRCKDILYPKEKTVDLQYMMDVFKAISPSNPEVAYNKFMKDLPEILGKQKLPDKETLLEETDISREDIMER